MKVDISYTEDGECTSKIEIVPQDVWNVDVTCSHLICALLESFCKIQKYSFPAMLDREDVLKFAKEDEINAVNLYYENNEHFSDTLVKIWARMLDDMVYGFKGYNNFDSYEDTRESLRAKNGRMLFFKYYECLWD